MRERFLAKLDAQLPLIGCWVWRGAHSAAGYGLLRVGRRVLYAHRLAYEHLIGPIPRGLIIDHTCRRRDCVNAAHLEPVTNAENVRRGRATREAA